jgi:hypothetical protein
LFGYQSRGSYYCFVVTIQPSGKLTFPEGAIKICFYQSSAAPSWKAAQPESLRFVFIMIAINRRIYAQSWIVWLDFAACCECSWLSIVPVARCQYGRRGYPVSDD